MNSDPHFNKVSIDKVALTDQDMYEYTKGNIDFGAEYLWIRSDDSSSPIGFIQYLPKNPHDGMTWIGLLVVHLEHQKKRIRNSCSEKA